ncbi:MAG: helix-turn-helix domain-containing protein [Anaerolineae bacterium]|nr:helix-turn-helix domain-containing protein [Anaerolineae bacterium]
MSTRRQSFGEKLRELRKRSGMSQIEVVEALQELYGEQIRISQATLSALEQRADSPKTDLVELLANFFQVPVGYFDEGRQRDEYNGIELAKAYLKQRRNEPMSGPVHARSDGFRSNGDDVERSLRQLETRDFHDTDSDEQGFFDT